MFSQKGKGHRGVFKTKPNAEDSVLKKLLSLKKMRKWNPGSVCYFGGLLKIGKQIWLCLGLLEDKECVSKRIHVSRNFFGFASQFLFIKHEQCISIVIYR